MSFDGATFQPEFDQARLDTQLDRVKALMLDGVYRTLAEIKGFAGGSEASVSARLRDLRKKKFGEYNVERRRRGDPRSGLWEYRVTGRYVQSEIPL